MMAARHARGIVILAAAGLFGIVLAAAGCGSPEPFRLAYLSDAERLVGGGLKIDWKAPEPGTAYLVEKSTGKLVETRTLETGEAYTFSVESIVEADELEQLLGMPLAETEFLLYFQPAEPSRPAGQETQ